MSNAQTIAENIPSSVIVGSLFKDFKIKSYSSLLIPCSLTSSFVIFVKTSSPPRI